MRDGVESYSTIDLSLLKQRCHELHKRLEPDMALASCLGFYSQVRLTVGEANLILESLELLECFLRRELSCRR